MLEAPGHLRARIRLAWDHRLVLRINDEPLLDLGHQDNFDERLLELPARKGGNVVDVVLSNTGNFNQGGWAFSFHTTTAGGAMLIPRARREVEPCDGASLTMLGRPVVVSGAC